MTAIDFVSDNGADLFIDCIQANGLEERLRVCYAFANYKDIQIAQRDRQIAQRDVKIAHLEEQIQKLHQLTKE